VKLLLSERQETATGLVHWIAEMPAVREALKRNDRATLFQQLLPLVGSVQIDFIEILDPEGRIFLRVHDPSVFGDRPALAKDIQERMRRIDPDYVPGSTARPLAVAEAEAEVSR
jgi:sensor histidine kinase regulating citrate/malate metabolism